MVDIERTGQTSEKDGRISFHPDTLKLSSMNKAAEDAIIRLYARVSSRIKVLSTDFIGVPLSSVFDPHKYLRNKEGRGERSEFAMDMINLVRELTAENERLAKELADKDKTITQHLKDQEKTQEKLRKALVVDVENEGLKGTIDGLKQEYFETAINFLHYLANVAEEKSGQVGRAEKTKKLVESITRKIRVHQQANKKELEESGLLEEILTDEHEENIRHAAYLCGLGYIRIRESVLRKKFDELTDKEKAVLAIIPVYSLDLINRFKKMHPSLERLGTIAAIVEQYRERVNGTGKPKGLKGRQIRLEAKILGVADSFIAMVSPREYQEVKSMEDALATFDHEDVKQKYDPLCLKILKEIYAKGELKQIISSPSSGTAS